jgi:hypothetical protein
MSLGLHGMPTQAETGDTRQMLRSTGLVLCLLVLACDSKSAEPPTPPKVEWDQSGKRDSGKQGKPAESDTCMPGGLEAAHSVEIVRLPSGCRASSGGSIMAPSVIKSADELASALECDAGVERPTIDFGKSQVMLVEFSMSPAYGGSEVFDDGSKVTFLQRDRSPCPDDPLPMPMQTSLAYLLPPDAQRTYHQASCTLPARCD